MFRRHQKYQKLERIIVNKFTNAWMRKERKKSLKGRSVSVRHEWYAVISKIKIKKIMMTIIYNTRHERKRKINKVLIVLRDTRAGRKEGKILREEFFQSEK